MIILRNNELFCTCCGGSYKLAYPMPASEMVKKSEAFTALHSDCKQTWVEPVADQSKPVNLKAIWWLENGERGMSSETMYNFFMGKKNFSINHPYDPDDFKRCYKLLEAVPEWKCEIKRLGVLSKAWKNLAENWDKLTAMYERNVKDKWNNYKEVGMYEFMQTLIR